MDTFVFAYVIGKNSRTPNLSPVADNAITRGVFGVLYICGSATLLHQWAAKHFQNISLIVIELYFFQDPSKRFGASLGALSGGRVGITSMATTNLKSALTIAIRYSCVRRQFGPTPKEELPVIEYQMQVGIIQESATCGTFD